MTIGHTWSSYYELVKIRRIPEGWKRVSWRRRKNAQYPIFRSTRATARDRLGTSVFWKRPFCISETDANERVLAGWKNAKESRLCSRLGPFANPFHRQRLTFSSRMCMMHLSRKQYPAISLSNSLVIRCGHCALDSSLFLSPCRSRNSVLQRGVTPSLPLVQFFRLMKTAGE